MLNFLILKKKKKKKKKSVRGCKWEMLSVERMFAGYTITLSVFFIQR